MTDVGRWTKFKLSNKHRHSPPTCEKCGLPFKLNDLFVYKGKRCIGTERYYHLPCWDSIFVDTEDLTLEQLEEELMNS